MKSIEDALEIAKDWILKNRNIKYCKIHEDVTQELKNGWIFFYSDPTFEHSYLNYPLFIDKYNGHILLINSFLKDEMIKEYEEKQGYL